MIWQQAAVYQESHFLWRETKGRWSASLPDGEAELLIS